MGDPAISIGPGLTKIPKGDGWTVLSTGLLRPADAQTLIHGQLAVSLSETIISRAPGCEIQLVRVRPGFPEDPTGDDDHPFMFTISSTGKITIRKRQNWLYNNTMRTYSDEPLRIEARHPGPVTINLEWVIKAYLLRAEVGRGG